MIEGPRAVLLHVTDLDIGRAWYGRALDTEPDFCDAESVTFYVGGCRLTLKLTGASGHAGTSVYWGVDNLADEYRRISEIGRGPAPSAQLAHIDPDAMEVLDPFGNVFGLVAVDGRSERSARHRRTAQKLALQNVRETLDQLQEKEAAQRRINRVIAWVVTVAVLLALAFAWTIASMQARPADTLPKLPLGAAGK